MTPEEHYEKAIEEGAWYDAVAAHALMVLATDVIERRAAEASAVKMEVVSFEAMPIDTELTLDEALDNLVTALNEAEDKSIAGIDLRNSTVVDSEGVSAVVWNSVKLRWQRI
jgi:hypothetical protein